MNLDEKLGLFFFGIPQYFSYALFSYFFSRKVLSKNTCSKFLIEFNSVGFSRGNDVDISRVIAINQELEKLYDLYKEGALTKEEFKKAKDKVLSQ